jgi:hypothetical protein
MADQCGPWSIDQLDLFGTIDSIQITLDSPIWDSADTCILEFAGDITGEGSVTVQGNYTAQGEGQIAGTGTLASGAERTRTVEGIIAGAGTLATACVRIRADNLASIFGEGTLSAFGGLEAKRGCPSCLGGGELIVIPSITFSSLVALQATGVLSGSGYIYGQEWSPVAEETNTWTPAAVESNTWTPVTAGTNTWAQNG